MSAQLAIAQPRRIKASHRRRRKVAAGPIVQRYYDPAIGAFLSVDPVATNPNTGASFCRYCYANNNPYRFTDPDGRQSVGELIDSSAEGCGAVSCAGWAVLSATWKVLGAEGLSQVLDKGDAASAGDKAGAAFEVAAVLPPVKILGEVVTVTKALQPSLKTVAKIERQLASDGLKSVLKSQSKLERRLAEHTEKLGQIREAGGHTSSVEREIAGFKKELAAIKSVLEQNQ